MIPFNQFHTESALSFQNELRRLVPEIIRAAQSVYDAWEGENDPEIGNGGICDNIAEEIGRVVSDVPGVEIYQGGQDGDDHAYVIAYKDGIAYAVDIPYWIYERGGGYRWTKIPGIRFTPSDVSIERVDYRPDDA